MAFFVSQSYDDVDDASIVCGLPRVQAPPTGHDWAIMNHLPPTELLDEIHTFPGRFTFKAIGLTNDDFALRVVAVVRATLQQDFDAPYELRETSGRRHIAVTVEPWVETSQQVIEVFTAIRGLEGLVMLL